MTQPTVKRNGQNVWRAPEVLVGDLILPVKFKLEPKRQWVWCATPGMPLFRVLKSGTTFYACKSNELDRVKAQTPQQAFAEGVKLFWQKYSDSDNDCIEDFNQE